MILPVLSLVAGWHAGVLVPVSGHASRPPGATSLTRERRPIHPRRARKGRDGTDGVYPDASLALDERSYTTPDTRKPGPQGAGWYIRKLTLFRSAAGVIGGFAGHFVIVVSVGEQQLRKRQALKEAEQTREAAGRAAAQMTRASGLSLFSRFLLRSRLRVRGNAVKRQMAHVRRVEEYVKEQNDPWPSGRSSGRTQSRRARRLQERHARENVRKLEGPQVSRLVRRTKKLNKAIAKTHGAIEAAKRNSGR